RRPVDGHEALQLPHHARRREAAAHVDRQGVTARLVDDGQDLQAPAVSGGVHHEIKRPHLVRYRRHAPLAAVTRLTQPPALGRPAAAPSGPPGATGAARAYGSRATPPA